MEQLELFPLQPSETIKSLHEKRLDTVKSNLHHHEEYFKCKNDPEYFISAYVLTKTVLRRHELNPKETFIYDKQREMLQDFISDNCTTFVNRRQHDGTSTIALAYILWSITFTSNNCICICSHNRSASTQLLDILRYMHHNLPEHLRKPISLDDKTHIKFNNNNNSHNDVYLISPTSMYIKGRSVTMLYVDNFTYIDQLKFYSFMECTVPLIIANGKIILTSTR